MRVSQADEGDAKAGRREFVHSPTGSLSHSRSVPRSDRQEACAITESGGDRRDARLSFLWIYVGIVGSLLLRLSVLDYESGDYKAFLSRWYDYFVEHGRLTAFKDDFTRYPLLYLYVVSLSTLLPLPKLYAIKLFSILADYVAAWFIFKIVRHQFPQGPLPWVAALVMLLLPTVWFNSAVWGQCDAMFTAGLLAALYYVIVKKPLAAMVAFGLACALKPQAIYFVPFLAGWFFRERMPWKYVAVPPLVYALCGVPAIIGGKPVWDVLSRWTQHRNAPQLRELSLGATNWYQWVSNSYYEIFLLPGIVLAIVAAVFLILAMQEKFHAKSLTLSLPPFGGERVAEAKAQGIVNSEGAAHETWLVTAALLSVLVVPYFLPGMHERYFYPADLLSLIYAVFVARGWVVAVLVQFCSFFTYLPYLFNQEPVPRPLLAIVMTVALAWVAIEFGKPLFQSLGDRQAEKGKR